MLLKGGHISIEYFACVLCGRFLCALKTTYHHHIQQLEQFHQRYLRKIVTIKWQGRVSNLEVLQRCGLSSIKSLLIQSQLRWKGHVVHMTNAKIPKMLLYGQLKEGQRDLGRPRKRFKDALEGKSQSMWHRRCFLENMLLIVLAGIQEILEQTNPDHQCKARQKEAGLTHRNEHVGNAVREPL